MINLYRGVKSAHLNQPFGYNLAYAKLDPDGNAIRPFKIITILPGTLAPAGYAPFYGLLGMKGHNGDDWMAYHGEPIYFGATDGVGNSIEGTCYTEVDPDGGIGVDIVFQDPDTKEWLQQKEWHLLKVAVYDGQVIKSGDLIGYCDTTGASSGDHDHDGFKPLNSSSLEDKKFPNNGYTGSVDPRTYPGVTDYRESSFILDILNLKQQLTLMQQIYKLLLILKNAVQRSK